MLNRIAMLILTTFVLVGLVGGCAAMQNSPATTPDKNDPNYHCRDKDGAVIVNSDWCFPKDDTHTCCIGEYMACVPGGCAYQGDPDMFGAPRGVQPRVDDDLIATRR